MQGTYVAFNLDFFAQQLHVKHFTDDDHHKWFKVKHGGTHIHTTRAALTVRKGKWHERRIISNRKCLKRYFHLSGCPINWAPKEWRQLVFREASLFVAHVKILTAAIVCSIGLCSLSASVARLFCRIDITENWKELWVALTGSSSSLCGGLLAGAVWVLALCYEVKGCEGVGRVRLKLDMAFCNLCRKL